MSSEESAVPVDVSRLLARDYWLILSNPTAGTDRAGINAHVAEHIAWLLELERADGVLVSGPLLSGPGVGPGSGMTVLRAADEDTARRIAEEDPLRAGRVADVPGVPVAAQRGQRVCADVAGHGNL